MGPKDVAYLVLPPGPSRYSNLWLCGRRIRQPTLPALHNRQFRPPLSPKIRRIPLSGDSRPSHSATITSALRLQPSTWKLENYDVAMLGAAYSAQTAASTLFRRCSGFSRPIQSGPGSWLLWGFTWTTLVHISTSRPHGVEFVEPLFKMTNGGLFSGVPGTYNHRMAFP